MKIIYCLNSVRGVGGIQRITIAKANALAEIAGNQVYILVTDNWDFHPLVSDLSPKVRLIDLGIGYYKDDYKSKLHRLKSNLRLFSHFRRLQRQVDTIAPDVIVAVGQGEKYLVPFLRTKAVRIREVHFNSNYRDFTYRSRLTAKILRYVDYTLMAGRYDKVVLLTKEDKETNFPHNGRFTYIHNLSTLPVAADYVPKPAKNVVAVGRLTPQKDFCSLIRAWKTASPQCPGWTLTIVGEGGERKKLERLIRDLGLERSVVLKGYSREVAKELENSAIFALTSLFEGFGLVIVEAMSKGIPAVAYTCPFGPRDIVQDGVSGFLVENRDEQALAQRIATLANDEKLRTEMGKAALKRAKDFGLSAILPQWMELFREELRKKNGK